MTAHLLVRLFSLVTCVHTQAEFRGNNVKGQVVVHFNGTSGALCGKYRCVDPAICYLQTCLCPHGTKGDGRIGCFHNTSYVAHIVGDPVMTTFANERVHLPFPCRFRLTHFITPHYMGPSGGTCEIQVYGLNYFTRGGYYVMGLDCSIQITNNARAGVTGDISLRIFGLEANGRWRYLVQGKNTVDPLTPWGAPSAVSFMDTSINITFDNVHNLATLIVRECGFRLRFRAFVHYSHQLPGLAVAVKDRPGLVFVKDTEDLCSSPFHFTEPYLVNLKRKLKLKKTEAILYVALNQNTRQDFGFGAVPCNVAIKEFLRICSTTREQVFAVKMCSFLYLNKSTAFCLLSDEFGESTGSIFGMCVQALCSEHSGLCNDVRDELLLYQCPIPEPFASLDCSQLRAAKLTHYPDELH